MAPNFQRIWQNFFKTFSPLSSYFSIFGPLKFFKNIFDELAIDIKWLINIF